jgi:membrane protease YdiL (CAAX protease family)
MLAFVLIVGFPVLLTVGFATLYTVLPRLGVDRGTLDRHGVLVFLLLLAIPLVVVVGSTNPGFAWPSGVGLVLGAVVGTLLFFNELSLSRLLLRWTRQRSEVRRSFDGLTGQRSGWRWALLLGALIAVAIGEEILWRGYLIRHLHEAFQLPVSLAVLLAGLSFGLNHFYFGLRNVLFKTFAGCVWGCLYLWTASLWTVIVSHAVYDGLVWLRLRRRSLSRR